MTRLFTILAALLAALPALAGCPNAPLPLPEVPGAVWVCPAGYSAAVDPKRKIALVVAYRLTGPHTLGCNARGDNFHAEPSLPPEDRASPADWLHSGYDLGHQAPAQDFAWDSARMPESFSTANMTAQAPHLNEWQWERGEESVRAWALGRGEVDVYTGPVLAADAKTLPGGEAIPDGYWKLVVDRKAGQSIALEMPNVPTPKGDLAPSLSSVDAIARDAGITVPDTPPSSASVWPADLGAWHKAHKAACGG